MAKTNVLSHEQWIEVKNEFMLGKSANAIAKHFGVTHKTITYKAKKEGWIHGQLSTQMAEIASNVASVTSLISDEQKPGIQKHINEVLQLQTTVDNFVKGAVELNMKNLQATLAEPNHEKRINMTARMKATMSDIASISQNRPTLKSDEANSNNRLIIEYVSAKNSSGEIKDKDNYCT